MKSGKFEKISCILLAAIILGSLWVPVQAGLLALVFSCIAGWYVSTKATTNKLKWAALVPVLPSVVLQGLYLLDRAVYYPWWLNVLFFVVNLGVAVLAACAGGFVPYWRDRQRKRLQQEHIKRVAHGRNSITRLFASVTLTAFAGQLLITSFFLVPGSAIAETIQKQTVDEFFKSYDPENDYQPGAEPVVPPLPPGSIPVSQMTPSQLQEYCIEYGYAAGEPACSYQLEYYEGSPVEEPWYIQQSVVAQMMKESNGKGEVGKNSSKSSTANSSAKAKSKSSTQQTQNKNLWYHTKQAGKGIWDTGASLVGGVLKAAGAGISWVAKNPKQALNGAKQVMSLLNQVTAIPTLYKAGKYVYDNRSTIAKTAIALKQSGDKYGWNNVVAAALFSPEAVQAWKSGEYGYAIGRGMSEFALNIVTLIPPLAAAKVPVIGKHLATGIRAINKIDDLISGVQLIKVVSKPAVQVFEKVPQVMGISRMAESTITTAVRNQDVVQVVEKVVTTTQKEIPSQSVLQKATNALLDINPVAQDVTTVNPQKVQETAVTISKLYTEGKIYDTAFSTLNHTLETGSATSEQVATTLTKTAEHKGVQNLIADTADPVVSQVITRNLTQTNISTETLDTLGTAIQKQDFTPIAVKTAQDGTPEILTINKKTNEVSVHYVASDGKLISKLYTPKQEDGFVGGQLFAQMNESGTSLVAKTSAKDGYQMANLSRSSDYEKEVADILNNTQKPNIPAKDTLNTIQTIIQKDITVHSTALSSELGIPAHQVEQAITFGMQKAGSTKIEKEITKILQIDTADTPVMASKVYAAVGTYTGSDETLLKLLNKVKTDTDIRSLTTIANNNNLTYITTKATNEELSILMNRMKKNNGNNILDIFQDGSIEHFIEGGVNRNGNATGFHSGLSDKGTVVVEGQKDYKTGVYEAGITVNGIGKTTNSGKSTLFPDDWGIIKILDAVEEAYYDPSLSLVTGTTNQYETMTKRKVKIGMYLNSHRKITSAFPVL